MSLNPALPLPLYLTGAGCELVASDGIALRMRAPHRPERRLPLARISHIVSQRDVGWETAALLDCMAHRIPVTFTDGRGQVLGYLLPARGREYDFHEVLESLFDHPGGRAIYDTWLRVERNRLWREWMHAAKKRGERLDRRLLDAQIQRTVYRNEPLIPLPSCLREAIAGCVAAWLAGRDAALRYWDAEGHPVELADDLAGWLALAWGLELGSLGERLADDVQLQLTRFYQRRLKLTGRVHAALSRLHRRALGALEPWR